MLLAVEGRQETFRPRKWWWWLWFPQTSLPVPGKSHYQDMSPQFHLLWAPHSESSCELWAGGAGLTLEAFRRVHLPLPEQFVLAVVGKSDQYFVIHSGS